jgi:hypothetical protein
MALYRYKLYLEDGSDVCDAHYAFLVQPGETILTSARGKWRVLAVGPVEEEGSPYVGLLTVAPWRG